LELERPPFCAEGADAGGVLEESDDTARVFAHASNADCVSDYSINADSVFDDDAVSGIALDGSGPVASDESDAEN
jgi:hypothetical protein